MPQSPTHVRATLRGDDAFAPHRHTFLSGSYKRDTATRPRERSGNAQRSDVDIIVLTNHALHDDPTLEVDAIHAVMRQFGQFLLSKPEHSCVALRRDMQNLTIVDFRQELLKSRVRVGRYHELISGYAKQTHPTAGDDDLMRAEWPTSAPPYPVAA